MNQVEFVGYNPEFAKSFTDLNLAWIEKYFVAEPMDKIILADPQLHIIDKGGHIFFASVNGKIAGTFALLKIADHIFELAKMAVAEEQRGNKIGNRMMDFCIQKAKELKIRKLVLYSNTMLAPAIHLYRKYGFIEVPVESADYKRANIKMELDIN
jgi:N-acetylglutamate synthase-like GNAT family acetyltransferase